LKLDSVSLPFFRLPCSIVGQLLLGARIEGCRWLGLHQDEEEHAAAGKESATAIAASASDAALPGIAPASLERSDSTKSESAAESSDSARHPLASLLLPSTTARLQLFNSLLMATRERARNTPEFVFDTSNRWEEHIKEHSKADAGKAAAAAASASAAPSSSKPSLFEQLFTQLSGVSPVQLRGPIGEYSWKTSFSGAADEGAQGWVGMFKQSMAALCTQLVRSAQAAGGGGVGAGSDSLLLLCPNGTNEVGSNRNQLIVNPSLLGLSNLHRFVAFGQLLGCAIRSSTCLPLDLASVFWRVLLHGVDAILAGPHEQALRSGLRLLKSFDANAAGMLSYVLRETDPESFAALGLQWTTFLSGGALVDLFPGGNKREIAFEERTRYVRLVLHARLNESSAAMQAIRFGLRSVIPSTLPCWSVTPLFGRGDCLSEFLPFPSGPLHVLTASDLELLVAGVPDIDLALLRSRTVYKGTAADGSAPLIQWFWQVLEEWSPADRAKFLQFAWGRARLPANFASERQHMTINVVELPSSWRARWPTRVAAVGGDNATPPPPLPSVADAASLRLPKSQTCFFIVDMPAFPSLDILRHKLTLALDCTDINF